MYTGLMHSVCCSRALESNSSSAGADPEIEEGGGHTYRVEFGAARVGRSCPCAR